MGVDVSEWQPIETAPRCDEDGSVAVLVTHSPCISRPPIMIARLTAKGWMLNKRNKLPWVPTHWMPLPEPVAQPATAEDGDPVENVIIRALERRMIRYERPEQKFGQPTLDFFLPDFGVFIEVCAYFTDRKVKQMSGVKNAILIQGKPAAQAFANLIMVPEPPTLPAPYWPAAMRTDR